MNSTATVAKIKKNAPTVLQERKNGIDSLVNGEFRDKRKSKRFFVRADKLASKTELPGLRQTIFADRYSLKDVNGEPQEKHPEQMWRRVARGIAQFEANAKLRKVWEERFYSVMSGFKFVPGGRILSGAGTGSEVTFFNCYVIRKFNCGFG